MIAQAGEPIDPRPPGDVQERAVPRMTPGTKPMTRLEGGVIEGSRLQANPGYVLEPLPGGRVMLRPNGGGLGVEANCRCESSGSCSVQIVGPEARCVKTEGKGCKTPCYMTVGGGKLQMR